MINSDNCSMMFDQTSSSSLSTAITYANSSIDERDILMKNLQKLIKAHQQAAVEQHQQPVCSGFSESVSEISQNDLEGSCQTLRSNLPLFLAHDFEHSALKSTIVNGKALGCFVIGGECRLCFPQMRALCLGEISTQQIDGAMKFLAIVNALASDEQLLILKRAGLADPCVSTCELITKTNAERLISMLNSVGTSPIDDDRRSQLRSLGVVHDCFGGCSALLFPELAPNPCFECRTCLHMFKPEDFCRHTHRPTSNKNECFWGFDASNWPFYIRVDDEGVPIDEDAERQFVHFVQSYPNHQI